MRVVLVGGSGHGFQHLQVWRKHAAVTELTVIGRDAGRLQALGQQFDLRTGTDLAEACDKADLVDIATPTDTHAALAHISLDAGVPTIVEKPPCRTVQAAEALRTAAGPVPLGCVLNYRHSPVWLRVRELIAWGAIGRPKLSLWPVLADNRHLMGADNFRGDAARGGGALLDGGFHLIDLIPWVLGRPLTAVTAWLGRLAVKAPAGEDSALAIYEHEGGVAQLTYCWAVPNPPRTPAATLIGDEATLVVPRSAKQPIELVRDRNLSELDMGQYRTMSRNDLSNCLLHLADHPDEPAFAETFDTALATQRIVELTEQSALEGRRVELS